jgi:hypothetical protein
MMNKYVILLLLATAVACKDKEAEKKIAALEARLAQLEGNKKDQASRTFTGDGQDAISVGEQQKPEGPLPEFSFEKTEHDFGTIKEGETVSYTFKFKNTGQAPLIISKVQPSCGCTAPDWSKEPIPVGGEGFVKVEFDSNGKPNIQQKSVNVIANTWPQVTVLRFKAMVTPKDQK